MEHFFSKLAEEIGFNVLAQQAGVNPQTIYRFVKNPRPNQKRSRRRIVEAAITQCESRLPELEAKIEETKAILQQLETWKGEFK